MRATSIKTASYKDSLARKRRQSFYIKASIAGFIIFLIIAGAFYLIFFSSLLKIKEIRVEGLDEASRNNIIKELEQYKDQDLWGIIPLRENIIFFDSQRVREELMRKYETLKSVEIDKDYLNSMILRAVERKPAGVWCFENYVGEDKCKYFDSDLNLWGQPTKSSGFVILTVEDQKQFDRQVIDREYYEAIMSAVKELKQSLAIRSVVILKDSISDIKFYTDKSYYLLFSLDSKFNEQLEVFKIFLDNKKDDPSFRPEYVDLRIDGRVYYK